MKICSFSTHSHVLPSTVATVNEIAKHIDCVFLLIDEKQNIKGLSKNVTILEFENKGMDFGKHLQFFHYAEENLIQIDELLLSNDTIDAIDSFDSLFAFIKQSKADFLGATDGYTQREGQQSVNGRHIQSFFLYLKGKSVDHVISYFKRNGFLPKRPGVKIYEMGTSRYLLAKGYTGEAFIKADYIMKKYGFFRKDHIRFQKYNENIQKDDGEFNGSFEYPQLYVEEGLPFVKNTCMNYDFNPPIIQYLCNRLYSMKK